MAVPYRVRHDKGMSKSEICTLGCGWVRYSDIKRLRHVHALTLIRLNR